MAKAIRHRKLSQKSLVRLSVALYRKTRNRWDKEGKPARLNQLALRVRRAHVASPINTNGQTSKFLAERRHYSQKEAEPFQSAGISQSISIRERV